MDDAAMTQWSILTANYFEEFFNIKEEEGDTTTGDHIRRQVYDVEVIIENVS